MQKGGFEFLDGHTVSQQWSHSISFPRHFKYSRVSRCFESISFTPDMLDYRVEANHGLRAWLSFHPVFLSWRDLSTLTHFLSVPRSTYRRVFASYLSPVGPRSENDNSEDLQAFTEQGPEWFG